MSPRGCRSAFFIPLALLLPIPTDRPARAQEAIVGTEGRIQSEVAIQSEEYGQARHRFKTRLLRHGAAPQNDSMPPAPQGVTVLPYVSDGLRLSAWINRPGQPDTRRRPAVLFLHGGFSFGPLDWKMAQAFRDSGYVVMAPMFRGEN